MNRFNGNDLVPVASQCFLKYKLKKHIQLCILHIIIKYTILISIFYIKNKGTKSVYFDYFTIIY